MSHLFATKSVEQLQQDAASATEGSQHGPGPVTLRRVLGPVGLTAIGVGAIIGSGIFVMTGRVAAQDAGPGIMLSFVIAGLACALAALCYAELAAMVPAAGSAYSYSYATLGELVAWIMGWDLILEYAMACSTVAVGWSFYFDQLVFDVAGIHLPDSLVSAPGTAPGALFNLPAIIITAIITVVLLIGVRESATTNAALVGIKVGVVLLVIAVGIFLVQPANWTGVPVEERVTTKQTKSIGQAAEEYTKQIAYPDLPKDAPSDQKVEREKLQNKKIKLWTEQAIAADRIQLVEQVAKKEIQEKRFTPEQAQARIDKAKALYGPPDEKHIADAKADKKDYGRHLPVDAEDKIAVAVILPLADHFAQDMPGRIEKAAGNSEARAKQGVATLRQSAIKNGLIDSETAGFITVGQRQALEKQVDDVYGPSLASSSEDRAAVGTILDAVKKLPPPDDASRWGLLGTLGLHHAFTPADDAIRSPFFPYGLSGVIFGASLVFFAYIGFDAVSTHAEEAVNPQRNVPIGILVSLLVCTVLYIGVAAVLTGMREYQTIPPKAAVSTVFSDLNTWWGTLVAILVGVGGLAGMTSVLLISFQAQSRIFLAMARDGLLPKSVFATLHPRFRTPYISIIIVGIAIAGVAAFTPISVLEEMVNIGTLLAFSIVCGAVMVLRVRRADAARPFRTPLVWVVAPLGILANVILMLFLPWETWLRLVVWLGIGLVIYFSFGYWNSRVGRELRTRSAAGA